MPCLRHSSYQHTSLGQQTYIFMNYQGRVWCRGFLLLMYLPPSFHHLTVSQIQWHAMDAVSLLYVIGFPLLWVSHYMTRWHSFIMKPNQVVGHVLIDVLYVAVQLPGCQILRPNDVLFRLVLQADILEDYQVSSRVLVCLCHLECGVQCHLLL